MKEATTAKKSSPEKTATEKLAEFIASTTFDKLPASAVALAKNALIDWLGVSIAGSKEPGARILADYIRKAEARKDSSVIGLGFKTTAEFAAFANGNTGHSIDFDDTNPDTAHYNMHPSTVVMPAALAVAEKYHKTGRQMLTGYVVGMETIYRVGGAIGAANSKAGWHPTPIIGSIGTAAACANLLGLNPLQTRYALGIAASLAGGLRYNFGSMTKPMHAGNAARNGVLAVELAAAGFTSNPDILDGNDSFCRMFGEGKPLEGLLGQEIGLGEEWKFVSLGIGFKYYPSCRSTHTSIDATRYIRNKYNVKPDQVAEITCKINPHHLNMAKFLKPEIGYQGKFSIPYCIVTALRNGNVILSDFADDKVKDSSTQALISKVKFIPSVPKEGVVELGARITVRLNDGKEYSHEVTSPTGEPQNPVSDEELADKFKVCSSLVLNKKDSGRILEIVRAFETVEDLTPLLDIIIKPSKAK
jgi:2-methylcitrate dehydratase PrpD